MKTKTVLKHSDFSVNFDQAKVNSLSENVEIFSVEKSIETLNIFIDKFAINIDELWWWAQEKGIIIQKIEFQYFIDISNMLFKNQNCYLQISNGSDRFSQIALTHINNINLILENCNFNEIMIFDKNYEGVLFYTHHDDIILIGSFK